MLRTLTITSMTTTEKRTLQAKRNNDFSKRLVRCSDLQGRNLEAIDLINFGLTRGQAIHILDPAYGNEILKIDEATRVAIAADLV